MSGVHRRPLVAVIGSGNADTLTAELAEALGGALAARGFSLLCGGRGGVMEAAARGACLQRARADSGLERDVVTIGLLPEAHHRCANRWLDIAIPTGLGLARNTLVALGADAVIAVCGMSGTLSEIAFAYHSHRPLCALATSGGWAEKLAGQALDPSRDDVIFPANSPEDAANWALRVLGAGS